MKQFMDQDFLLQTECAKRLYHDYAKAMPIIDYHCHINPQEIWEDHRYQTITELWLGGDHYKWRAMRGQGIAENCITSGDPYEIFESYARTLPNLIGNPLYHWSYLELKRYFQIDQPLNPSTAREIYNACNKKLQQPDMSVRGLVLQSEVDIICTTDDPIDALQYHQYLRDDPTFSVQVLPSFRPDAGYAVHKTGYGAYISKLASACGHPINDFDDLVQALATRLDYFVAMSCRSADHGLNEINYQSASKQELNAIFNQALQAPVDPQKTAQFQTAMLIALSKLYHQHGLVMQLHFNCLRNVSSRSLELLGTDTGFDAINDHGIAGLGSLLDTMEQANHLPKMILYSLNERDNQMIASIATSFQRDAQCAGKIQLGSAWWFNDHLRGMEKQLQDLASIGMLSHFVGMLTDSRSFISYPRHEYFRRILCNVIGQWMEDGMIQSDFDEVGSIVQNISYHNTKNFFDFR